MTKREYNKKKQKEWYDRSKYKVICEIMKEGRKVLDLCGHDIKFCCVDDKQHKKTKHQKLEMEYKGFRYAGCPITDEEKKYIANDVLVVKEALEKMFSDGYNKLTIGACSMRS